MKLSDLSSNAAPQASNPTPAQKLAEKQTAPGKTYPAHQVIDLPALSPTMTEGSIAQWLVKEGDEFNEGDSIAEIETDKASVAFEMLDDGFVAKILVKEGQKNIPVGQPVIVVVNNKEDVDKFSDFEVGTAAVSAAAVTETTPVASTPVEVQQSSPEPIGETVSIFCLF